MRPPLSRAISFAILLAAPPATALAMLVPINHAQRIDVRGVAASVVVGNPNIASVTVVDTHTLYVMGRGPGSTNIVVLDKAGRPLYSGDVTVAASGENVNLYRGDKRVQVNCNRGCVEVGDGDNQPSVSMRGASAFPGVAAGAPGVTGGATVSTMP
jgi:Flp pilus assembly secretin CpaC